MASTDNAEAMRRARRVDSERKRRLVLAAADAQLEAGLGIPPSPASPGKPE